jgi:hypothetical protein
MKKYMVVKFDKEQTKYAFSIIAYIKVGGGEELYWIYLPKKYVETFEDTFISNFNKGEQGELHIQCNELSQKKAFNITFS